MCVCVCVCHNLSLSTQDYPSVSQIYSLLVQNDIIPIFSCTTDYLQGYIDLAKEIPGAQAAALTRNSDNLLQIIREEYSVSGLMMDMW